MPKLFLSLLAASLVAVFAQEQKPPQVRVNMLNVCQPSADDQKEISAALARVPRQPLFTEEFEVSRGRTALSDKPGMVQSGETVRFSGEPIFANWVRIRRDFSVQALFSSVQYSFSQDRQFMVETLVLRVKDPKDLMQIAIEDSASSVASASTMLAADTPASRIKLERFGKSSIVLARCLANPSSGEPAPDQSAYEALFRSASSLLAAYRGALKVHQTIPEELSRLGMMSGASTKPAAKPARKPAAQH